jgi:hypothetical protein
MPKTRPAVTNWSKGEISELLEGRTDLDQYYNSAKTIENFLVLQQGPAQRRPGMRFVKEVKDSTKLTRVVKFIASKTAAYMLEFGNNYIRFYKNNVRLEVAGVPVEVATPYVASDLRLLNFSQSNDVLYITSIFYEPRKLLRFSDFIWQLVFVGKPTSSDLFRTPPSYEYGQRPLAGATLTPGAVSGAGVTFTAGAATFQNSDVGREILIIDGTNIGARATITGFTSTTVVTGTITQNFINVAANAVSFWKITLSPQTGVTPSAAGPVGTTITLTLDVAGWRTGDIGRFVQLNGGIAEITGITSTVLVNAILRSALNATTKAESGAWTLEENSWSQANGFPSCDEFHTERHYYAGTLAQPQTFWGSKSGDFENFAVGVLDDDAVEFTISDSQLNPIVWMKSARHLLMGTTSGEFNVFGAQDTAITPTNIQVRPETSNGSTDDVQPFKVGAVVLYLTGSTRQIRELVYDYATDAYVSPDILLLAEHLTRNNGIVDMEYQRTPWGIIWAVRDDGMLLAAAYLRDQNVIAWNRHPTGTITVDADSGHGTSIDGFVESVAIIPHPNGDREQVWLVVQRKINGQTKRYVEYFDDGRFVYDRLHTDAAITFDGTGTVDFLVDVVGTPGSLFVVTASAPFFSAADVNREIRIIGTAARGTIEVFTDTQHVTARTINIFPDSALVNVPAGTWGVARNDISGVNHLEAQLVDVQGDGAALPQVTIVGGAATIQEKSIKIEIGIPYDSILTTVRAESPGGGGSSQGVPKHISDINLRLFQTLGCEVQDHEQVVFHQSGDLQNQPPPLFTGDKLIRGLLGWDRDGRFTVKQKQPLPITVSFMTGLVEVGGV